MSAAARDWAELPTKILGSIARFLTVEDYICFGAVCSSWGSAASPRDGFFLPLAPQMSWLLLPGDEGERGESCTIVDIHDRHCRRFGPIPEMRGKWCCGSQDGWLALLDEHSEVSLLNPLTRAQIHLPSVTTLHSVDPIYSDDGSLSGYQYNDLGFLECRNLDEFRCLSFTVMAMFSIYNQIAYATTTEGKWTLLTTGPSAPVSNIIYHGNRFLTVSYYGDLWAINVTRPSPQATMLAEGWGVKCSGEDKYLVDSSGELLQVWRRVYDGTNEHDSFKFSTTCIKMMKFDPEKAAWIPLNSLGDSSLFLGKCYSISLSALEISDLKRNCVYFTDVLRDWVLEENDELKQMTRDVGVFKLEDGSFDRYHPPNLLLNWPPPIWFAPSLL